MRSRVAMGLGLVGQDAVEWMMGISLVVVMVADLRVMGTVADVSIDTGLGDNFADHGIQENSYYLIQSSKLLFIIQNLSLSNLRWFDIHAN